MIYPRIKERVGGHLLKRSKSKRSLEKFRNAQEYVKNFIWEDIKKLNLWKNYLKNTSKYHRNSSRQIRSKSIEFWYPGWRFSKYLVSFWRFWKNTWNFRKNKAEKHLRRAKIKRNSLANHRNCQENIKNFIRENWTLQKWLKNHLKKSRK